MWYAPPPSSGSSSTAPRALPLRDVASILASSSSGHFTRHPLLPSVVRLEGLPLGTIADAIANPPTTWTLNNAARWASASASGDSITMTTVSSGTDILYNGTATAGHYSRAITRGSGRIGRIFHMAASTVSGGNTGVAVGILHSGVQWLAQADIYNTGFSTYLRYIVNNTVSANIVSLTSGQAATGAWVWLEVDLVSGGIWIRYALASYASGEPAVGSWTLGYHGLATAAYIDNALTDAITVERNFANTPPVGIVSGFRSYHTQDQSGYATSGGLDFTGYASASDAILLADLDMGSGLSRLPDITAVRLMLADAVNRVPGDAATWTWSLTGSDSAAPAGATTYQSAASLTLKQPSSDTTETVGRRYWRLRAKAESASGTQPGSLDLSRIPVIPLAA